MNRIIVAVLLMLPFLGLDKAQAASDQAYHLQLLEANARSVTIAFELFDYHLKKRQENGQDYQEIVVPGLGSLTTPGQPSLPGLGTLLGAPPDGIDRIKILPAEFETIPDVILAPNPTLTTTNSGRQEEIIKFDPTIYTQDALFPDSLADIGWQGYLRHQPVAQLRLYPFRYNPHRRTLHIYRRLHVQIFFAPSPAGQNSVLPPRPDNSYEQLIQTTLINSRHLPPLLSPARPKPAASPLAPVSSSALKIYVEADGLYRVTYGAMQEAGFDVSSIGPRFLQLTAGGMPSPIYVHGEADGSFDSGDWLEFYGTARADQFTNRNVYWLTVNDTPGSRMAVWTSSHTGTGATPSAFYATKQVEENHEYWPLLPNGAGRDHWFWKRFPPAPHTDTFSFDLSNIAGPDGADGMVRVTLQGRSTTDANPDHHTQIFLNNHFIDEAWWDGDIPFIHETAVPQAYFREGVNSLTVTTPGDTVSPLDTIYVDSLAIGYWRTYAAKDNQLDFTAPGTGVYAFTITDFNSPDIQIYDVTNTSVKRLADGLVEADGSHYRISFEDEADNNKRYLALTSDRKRTPVKLELDIPSAWKSPGHQADYLIITPKAFTAAVAPLADYYSKQGLRVAIVQIEDIFDEFSHGLFQPQAIRDFLRYAYHHWTPPAPLYVLLVGDANYDYRDYLASGTKNYIPTHLFESSIIGQTLSDNWFVTVNGDDPLPDMFIGRLPVKSSPEAGIIVDKILTYQQNASDPVTKNDWRKKTVFVADDEAIFELSSNGHIASLPGNYAAHPIYASHYPQPHDPTPDIIAAINEGALIVNYTGHGNVTTWGSWSGQNMLRNDDILNLLNGPRYPFLITGNCSNGFFAHPFQDALAERFIQQDGGGGVAAWSPTGLGLNAWHWTMISAFYRAVFDRDIYQLGPATTAAKIDTLTQLSWSEPVEIFTLFGDPALALNIIPPDIELTNTAPAFVQPGQDLTYTLAYVNYNDEQALNVVLTETYDENTTYQSAQPWPSQGNNVWDIGILPTGAGGTITVTVRVPDSIPKGTLLTNKVTLTSQNLDPKSAVANVFVGYAQYLPLIYR